MKTNKGLHYEKISALKVKQICEAAESCETCRYRSELPGGRYDCVFSLYVDAGHFPFDLPCRRGKDAGRKLYEDECLGHVCKFCRHYIEEINDCDMTACEPCEWRV